MPTMTVDDRVDHGSDERVDAQVVTYSGPRKHYVREEPLHLHFRWFLVERPIDGKEICARFHWLFDDVEGHFHRGAAGGTGHARPVIQDQDGAVFVDVVEFMEVPEGMTPRVGGVSLVWLRELHGCECAATNDDLEIVQGAGPGVPKVISLPRLADSFIGIELLQIIEDREVQVPLLLSGQWTPIDRDGVEQVVKGRPQLMEHVTERESPFKLWFKEVMGCNDYALPVSVVMEPKRLRGVFRAVTPKTTDLEVLEVFLGPFHFQPK